MALIENRGYPGDQDECVGELTMLPYEHPFRVAQRKMEQTERQNDGRNPEALWPLIREVCRYWYRKALGR